MHTKPEAAQSEKLSRLLMLLEDQFGDSAITPIVEGMNGYATPSGEFAPGLKISVPPMEATVWLKDLTVDCKSAALRNRVQAVVERAVETVSDLGSG